MAVVAVLHVYQSRVTMVGLAACWQSARIREADQHRHEKDKHTHHNALPPWPPGGCRLPHTVSHASISDESAASPCTRSDSIPVGGWILRVVAGPDSPLVRSG